jgi:hypothetical protein
MRILEARSRSGVGAVRLALVATLAAPILAGCTGDEDLKREAVQEARAACNVGRSAMVIMPNKHGSETVIVLKMFMSAKEAEFRCVKKFRSKLGYSFQPISIGDYPEAPE